MKKIIVVMFALSLILLSGCKSQTVGECSSCNKEEKLYYISQKKEGEEVSEKYPYCKSCAESNLEFMEALVEMADDDTYKLSIKKYYGDVEK